MEQSVLRTYTARVEPAIHGTVVLESSLLFKLIA